jgi:glycosyltransferase involved in cell wall biosynthesis/2-polyprenyl-3-methyl-5-hydroxy-6-metoxy-1,4-benzoquinol methylase
MRVTNCLYCDSANLKNITSRSDGVGILQCVHCSLLMVDSINDNTEVLYTSDYFQKEQHTKYGYIDYLSSPVANLIGKYAFAKLFTQSGNHLDLGCADGSLMEIFTADGFSSRGLEISKDAVKIANTKGMDVQYSRLHSFPKNLPGSDIITAYDLLEHVDKPGSVIKEVFDNLNEDGHFVFSTVSVKRIDPSDYWFNNSLEHYSYYTKENLEFILTDVFGEDNFIFLEMDINGIAEFWGVAKKEKIKSERTIIDMIRNTSFNKKDAEQAYLLSLFYNQTSQFAASQKISEYFSGRWPEDIYLLARFYNNFYQGQLEQAIKQADQAATLIPLSNSVFWQALASVQKAILRHSRPEIEEAAVTPTQTELLSAKQELELAQEEILSLRSQAFMLRDELHSLRNSRVVGRIIKTRDKIGNPATLPKRAAYKTRRKVAEYIPDQVRLPMMGALRKIRDQVRARARQHNNRAVTVTYVDNIKWSEEIPLVSVVIPYYNRADTIDDTLASLKAQTFRNFETIVVDDKSPDPVSIEKLKTIKATRIIRQETNKGVAEARNTGIREARGKYIICLDSDDMIDPTFIEKATLTLELNPDISLITTYQDMFGVVNELFEKHPYDPLRLIKDNMVITAAQFRREAWEVSGGFKPDLGYEDWDFWLTLSEHGFWGKLIPEPLFKYRTAMASRYVEDKDKHWNNIKRIQSLHPKYRSIIKSLLAQRRSRKQTVNPDTAFVNIVGKENYKVLENGRTNVLITVPWLDFGGVSTLLYNFMREVSQDVNLHVATGLPNKNEWDYKFREVTPFIYHMPSMFDEDPKLQLEFLSNYIKTRKIDILHLVHNGFVYDMLPELRKRHPKLKVISTVFNDRAPYLEQSIAHHESIDIFSSDNQAVGKIYTDRLTANRPVKVIPNGVDTNMEFNPEKFDREAVRKELKLRDDELAVFFIGRLSEEKNPDVFVEAAKVFQGLSSTTKVKFFIIGDGPMRKEILDQIYKEDIPNVLYLGYQKDVAKYLSAGDVFILPSAVEGFPLSILEAMAMKVAVIASNVGAVGDVIKSGVNGYIVKPGSVDEICDALSVLSDDKRRAVVQSKAREDAEKLYSSDQLGAHYRSLYKEVLS